MSFRNCSATILKTFLQRGQSALHAAIINITANFNAHAANQRWVLRKRKVQSGPIGVRQGGLNPGLQLGRQGRRTLDSASAALDIKFNQPEEMRENRQVTARLGLQDVLNGIADAALIEQAVR